MLKPVYALVGEDAFLQLQQLRDIAAQLPADAQRADFDGETAELASVLDELRSFSMFGGDTKLVVLRDADAFITRFREQLENYVEQPSTSGVLVLRLNSLPANQRIYKAIAKVGEVLSCAPPKDLSRWAVDRARQAHGLKLAPDIARLLVELVGEDLGRLDNELAKLALMSADGNVREEDVAGAVSFQREQEMWELTNALATGDFVGAINRWRQLLQTDPSTEFRAVTWLSMWLDDARSVLTAKRRGERPDFRKLWRYKGEKLNLFLRTVDALGERGVTRAIDLLTDVDRQSKSGIGEAATNVERFILSMATMKT